MQIPSILRLNECWHEGGKILTIKWYTYPRNCHWSYLSQDILYEPLMNSDTRGDRRISRTLDKTIRLFYSITKIRIIIYITKSIVICQKCQTWRGLFFIRIEIPIIIVHIIFPVIENISFVESKCHDRSRKTSIGTNLITILIQNHITSWITIPEHSKNIFFMIKIPWEVCGDFCKTTSHTVNFLSNLIIPGNPKIKISSLLYLIFYPKEIFTIISYPVSRWFDTKFSEQINILRFGTVQWGSITLFNNTSSSPNRNNREKSVACTSKGQASERRSFCHVYLTNRNPWKRREEKMGTLKGISCTCYHLLCIIETRHGRKRKKFCITIFERKLYIPENWSWKHQYWSQHSNETSLIFPEKFLYLFRLASYHEWAREWSYKKIRIPLFIWYFSHEPYIQRSIWNIERPHKIDMTFSSFSLGGTTRKDTRMSKIQVLEAMKTRNMYRWNLKNINIPSRERHII